MVASPTAKTAKSLTEFLEIIAKLEPQTRGFYTFRGERNAAWSLAPGVLRPNRKKLLVHERDAVRELLSVHPNEFLTDTTMFDKLVRMQHYGLPTRLLDVSANPLVGLFYATEVVDPALEPEADGKVSYIRVPDIRRKYFDSDAVSCIANLANMAEPEKAVLYKQRRDARGEFNKLIEVDRLVQFIRIEKPSFRRNVNPRDLDRVYYVVPKLNNRRIIAQNGAFLIFGLSLRPATPLQDPIQIRSIKIPAAHKAQIRKELSMLGVTKSSLFPEIDHAADHIVDRYK
ncbi:FRG domain-containing protein [Methylobacterium sp. Leaf123]|uniref:FRG domain-containing protein n=1 Tax=Methylobacterium sp. Leaf123 TaxID=1736264 RepID=UPI0009EADD66|nr:FRG domain-containing protein [Methylobacterium sp. Leaf123]